MLNQRMSFIALMLALVVMVACGGGGEAPTETASTPAPSSGNSAIQGSVSYTNGDPDAVIDMSADPKCDDMHSEEVYSSTVVASDGALANVFVYVKSGLAGGYAAPDASHLLDQRGCQYSPRVSGMMVGQPLKIRNSDDTLHNVHALPTKNEEFNQGQPFKDMELERTFDKAEVMIRFKCDVHPWMSSYMGVLDHPYYAVSGEDGSFAIDSLPAGTYTLEAWHEVLGTQTQEVTVGDGETASVTWEFAGADAAAAM